MAEQTNGRTCTRVTTSYPVVSKSTCIGVFIPNLAGGGAERVVSRLLGFLAKQHPRCTVHLIVMRNQLAYPVPVSVALHVLRNPKEEGGSWLRRLARQPIFFMRFVRLVRQLHIDSLLSFMPHTNVFNVLGRLLVRGWPRAVISERVAVDANYTGLRGAIMKMLIRVVYPHADTIIAVSEGVRSDLLKLGIPGSKLVAIPNPVDREELFAQVCAGPTQDAADVVAVGRLTRQKGFDNLINAFADVVRRRPGVRLKIIGEGPLMAALVDQVERAGLADSVELVGFRSNPFPLVSAAKVYVMSSRWEGFPNALLEAVALGKAIVATRCPHGPEELLENGESGVLVPVDDAASLADAIFSLLNDTELRRKYELAATVRAKDYAPLSIFGRYLAVLDLCSNPTRPR
jgi:glycosyltransferase involved in cell wall biosynthesis